MTKRQKKIVRAWDVLDDADISTERLFAMVESETGADAGDISEALYARETKRRSGNEAQAEVL